MDSQLNVRKIGKYKVLELLGSGATGSVYLALDPFVQRKVAIKVIPSTGQEGDSLLVGEASFLNEARANGALQHRNIATLWDAGVETGFFYLVMEYIDGQSLYEYCATHGQRLPPAKVRQLALDCALGLHYAHGQGVFHRDIKPSNIMLGPSGEAKLVDFGIAALLDNNLTRTSFVTGTPSYMAPEALRGARATAQSDLYSLGVVLCEVLAGRRPFHHLSPAEQMEAIGRALPPGVKELEPSVPADLAAIVDKMLDPHPEGRYKSAMDVVQALIRGAGTDRRKQARGAPVEIPEEVRTQLHKQVQRQKILAGMTEEQRQEILANAQFMQCQPGETVLKEGTDADSLYLVVRGSIEVRKNGKAIAKVDTGESFGEIGFVSEGKTSAAYVADRPTIVMRMYTTLVERLSAATQLALYQALCRTLSYRLRVATARLSTGG